MIGQDGTEAVLARARETLRGLGQRITPARLGVISVLATSTEHLGATQIAEQAGAAATGVHRATVYRALATLCELGLVTHTHTGAGAVYHLTLPSAPDEPHVHLECTRCHGLTDVPAAQLRPLAESLTRAYGFSLEPAHAALLGVCAGCAEVPAPTTS